MAELVVIENISLDGVMQSPGRPDEDTRNGFERGGWAGEWLQREPEAAMASMAGRASSTSMLFGHRTYTDLVGFWLSTPEPNPFTDVLRDTPKYVASRSTSTELAHPTSTLLAGEAVETVTGLKQSLDGEVVVLGSGELVRGLAAAGLVDRYVLTTIPVVLGWGARLFGDTPAEFTVERSQTFSSGIQVATYAVRRPEASG